MLGWDVATVVIANHGVAPFTVDLDSNGRPKVSSTGESRTIPLALWDFDDLIGVRIIEVFQSPILARFNGGILPVDTVETENGIQYTKMFSNSGTLLKNSMLDGWTITSVTPANNKNWRARVVNGEVVVTFYRDVYDGVVKVTLTKDGSTETMVLEIMFSGEEETVGCNAGASVLALLALCPLFIRRK
jgi:Synergist-CTERM protein sorting domain-containing protein